MDWDGTEHKKWALLQTDREQNRKASACKVSNLTISEKLPANIQAAFIPNLPSE